tara:strand:+ start:504 stop:947 length:444 start_codon:yes stop_codon:yes gene_type:complete
MELIFHKDDQWAFEALQKLSARSPDGYIKLLSMWKTMGSEGIVLSIKPPVRFKTRNQENYYRKWCGQFAKHCGLTPDEMHDEMLCITYGSEEVETKFGVRRRPVQRSSSASVKEYSELVETLIRVAAEMDFAIPPPDARQGDDNGIG